MSVENGCKWRYTAIKPGKPNKANKPVSESRELSSSRNVGVCAKQGSLLVVPETKDCSFGF